MEFSERTQVFIVASYYKHLTETFGERGKAAFLHGVKHYAMQRGRSGQERLWTMGPSAATASGSRQKRQRDQERQTRWRS